MKPIKLSFLADALEETFDGWEEYLNIETGRIISVPDDVGFADDPYSWEEIIAMIGKGNSLSGRVLRVPACLLYGAGEGLVPGAWGSIPFVRG